MPRRCAFIAEGGSRHHASVIVSMRMRRVMRARCIGAGNTRTCLMQAMFDFVASQARGSGF